MNDTPPEFTAKFSKDQLKSELKTILFLLAKNCDHPGIELQEVLREVVSELYDLVSSETQNRRKLRLV